MFGVCLVSLGLGQLKVDITTIGICPFETASLWGPLFGRLYFGGSVRTYNTLGRINSFLFSREKQALKM